MSELQPVADVVTRMRIIDADVAPDDGVAVFNRVYLDVTEQVLDRLHGHTTFHDDELMAGLDVRFASLWFAAYDAPDGRVPKAWAPLFAARHDRSLWPIQFALAGMNTHIEHDLAVAVVATCEASGVTPSSPGVREDYELVNDLLAEVEGGVRRSFLTEIGQAADGHVGALAHLVSSWSIEKARDVAWVNVQALWELRRSERLAEHYAAALAHTVGMGSRLLLAPVA